MAHDTQTRVACLYRVSTKKQVEENDIPLQKKACRAFIDHRHGWSLVCEYTEKGVSGYHKSAGQRDVLQKARRDAEQGRFDVLLVFMFDRLGRREDETPFVVEWFVQQGVEVWSVKEGQQRFDNRVDKLLNYIRFWQSGGESEKTSIRVKEKHRQMVMDGQYRGGGAPYGYKLVEAGITNPKGYPLKQMVVDAAESAVVQTIFRLAADQGYGGRRIARYLNDRRIPTKKGNPWRAVSVTDLLKNPIYMGCYVSGRRQAERGRTRRMPEQAWIYAREIISEWAVVSRAQWKRAEAIRLSRTSRKGASADVEQGIVNGADNDVDNGVGVSGMPLQTRGVLLLTGLAYCGVCGKRLISRYAMKQWRRKSDNAVVRYRQPAYRCPEPGRDRCTGQKTYAKRSVDGLVSLLLAPFWQSLLPLDMTGALQAAHENATRLQAALRLQWSAQISQTEQAIARLTHEIPESLRNASPFNTEQLSRALKEKEAELIALRRQYEQLPAQLLPVLSLDAPDEWGGLSGPGESKGAGHANKPTVIVNWQSVFEQAPLSTQKMLMTLFIRKVCVRKDCLQVYAAFNWYD